MKVIDHQREFRNALGTFATGVTVVTATSDNEQPIGMTVNSFASVSLDPPLVLWSIDKKCSDLNCFTQAEHYAIHVLKADQVDVSNAFASRDNGKFDKVNWRSCEVGTPLLEDYYTRFLCKAEHRYEGGDHIILVGRVIDFDYRDGEPLLFHCGKYGAIESA